MTPQAPDPEDGSGEDGDAPRPRWLGWAIVVFMLLVVLGLLNVGWLILRPAPAAQAPDGLQRHYAGPSLGQIAARRLTPAACAGTGCPTRWPASGA